MEAAITVGAGAVILPDSILRCGAEGMSIGRGAFIGRGVVCEARSIGDGAVIEQGCILVSLQWEGTGLAFPMHVRVARCRERALMSENAHCCCKEVSWSLVVLLLLTP